MKDLAQTLARIANTKVIFELPDEKERRGYSTATKAMLNADKLKKLGWNAQVHLIEGLKCTVEEIR